MRKLLMGVIAATVLVVTACVSAGCDGGSASSSTTTTAAVVATTTTAATTTTVAPTTTIQPTTTTANPLGEDSWYEIPFYEGATGVKAVGDSLNYTVEARVQTVHDYYLEIMPGLGYTLWTDALGGPQKMVAYDKDGIRMTIFMLPPTGGNGREYLCHVLIGRETIATETSATTVASTTSSTVAFTTPTAVVYRDAWHDIPIMKGASGASGNDSRVDFNVRNSVQTVDEYYAGVMEDLGYTVVSKVPGGMILSSTVYGKAGVETTITITPDPINPDACYVTMER
jgi:hypothetical protein